MSPLICAVLVLWYSKFCPYTSDPWADCDEEICICDIYLTTQSVKGFWCGAGQTFDFPVDWRRRRYNRTLSLPCECDNQRTIRYIDFSQFFLNEVVLVMQFSEWLSFTASVSASVKSLAVRGSRSINYYAPPPRRGIKRWCCLTSVCLTFYVCLSVCLSRISGLSRE